MKSKNLSNEIRKKRFYFNLSQSGMLNFVLYISILICSIISNNQVSGFSSSLKLETSSMNTGLHNRRSRSRSRSRPQPRRHTSNANQKIISNIRAGHSELSLSLSSSASASASSISNPIEEDKRPILIVGATGKVGRIVVQKLLDQNIPTRAFVRNATKANELFMDPTSSEKSKRNLNLEIIVGDVTDLTKMEEAVKGCQAAISVSGTLRFSKLLDFLPWRLFTFDVSNWCNDMSHPYYTNYVAQLNLAKLATKHQLSSGVVRLTGLSTGLSPFSLVSILFSSLLSMTSRYHYAAERDMYLECFSSNIPFIVIRPGGLSDEPRDSKAISLQIDSSGILPPPARVGRADIADLAIAAVSRSHLKKTGPCSRVLAVRWTGSDIKPKGQGVYEDGCIDANACFEKLTNDEESKGRDGVFQFDYPDRPYGFAVSCLVYPFIAFSFKFAYSIIRWIISKLVIF